MSRIVAIADAHLGRAHYQAVNQQGLNQREADFAASWHRAVDAALALNPDAVLVLGDLFDIPRPSYRAFREGAKGLRRLAASGVPTCAISGNGAPGRRSTCCRACACTRCRTAPARASSRSRSRRPPPPARSTT